MKNDPLWQQIVDAASQVLDVLAWPLVVVAILCFLASRRGSELFRGLIGRVRSISAGGFGVELTEEAAAELKASLEQVFDEYRKQARAEFARLAYRHDVEQLRNTLARTLIEPATAKKFKCTVYVPDVLFEDALYCLLDYFPKGAARGRTYSIRYGIIGKAWRLQQPQLESRVPGKTDSLIGSWGMTAAEATHASSRDQALLCVVLKSEDQPVGILFAESEPDAFAKDLVKQIEDSPQTARLADAVGKTLASMREKGPALRVFDA